MDRRDEHTGAGSCCGRPRQAVVLGDERTPVRLLRCTVCTRGDWLLHGTTTDRAAALAALGDAYREAPRRARAARDRAATARAARAAARSARTAAPSAAPPAAARVPADPATARSQELAELLRGWTVLGRTG